MPGIDLDDDEEMAQIEFQKSGAGRFQFLCVQAEMDVRYGDQDGKARANFCWEGMDEGNEISGRGEAILNDDGMMAGLIWVYKGDDYSFVAEKIGRKKTR